ncbi:fimbria/pilus outer membrane usher protein [Ideonella livida]|uniref:Fimbrial biogenesis outer membrane usher protein n=1 Tax=Ideonella livida TaxID=2707176 RepID=A0A7C9TN23_9BURK|nr:fimbria/pilus outer membrane usher protein [Ideonella livida]NDY92126.1 fimbrial biogenesis outer membrane usher protein [Ideonella livida]
MEEAPPVGPLIVELVVNGVPRGSQEVVAQADGDFLVSLDTLRGLGLARLPGTFLMQQGLPYASLRGMGVQEMRLDLQSLTLHVTLDPSWLPPQQLAMDPGRARLPPQRGTGTGWLNYQISSNGMPDRDEAPWQGQLSTELGLHLPQGLLLNETLHNRGEGGRLDYRAATRWVLDQPDLLRRWTLGDHTSSSLSLGDQRPLLGLGVQTVAGIDPYQQRQPSVSIRSAVASAAQMEVYLDGVRVRTEQVGAGPVVLSNLSTYSGLHDVTLVLRDALGRETVVRQSSYTDARQLRAGLSEYGYHLGVAQDRVGDEGPRYRGALASGFHRWGLDDRLTLGWMGQWGRDRHHLGPEVDWTLGRWGAINLAWAQGRHQGQADRAAQAGYQFGHRDWQLRAQWREVFEDDTIDGLLPWRRLVGQASVRLPAVGQLSMAWQRQAWRPSDVTPARQQLELGWNRALAPELLAGLSLSRPLAGAGTTQWLLTLSWLPRDRPSATLSQSREDGARTSALQLSAQPQLGEGLSWQLRAEHQRPDDGGEAQRLSAGALWNLPYGQAFAQARHDRSASGSTSFVPTLGWAGSLVWIAQRWAVSRPVQDAYGLVSLPDSPGVRVRLNQTDVGRTNAQGEIFLPQLGSYVQSQVSFEERDLSLNRISDSSQRLVRPGYRAGLDLRFEVRAWQVHQGRLRVQTPAGWRPAPYADLTVRVGDRVLQSPTGAQGEFFLDGLSPGRHLAVLVMPDRRCEFILEVPASTDPEVNLGELHACPTP